MRTSVKVLLGIGGALLVGGIVLMGVGVSKLGELEDPFILKEVTNGTIMLHDDDGEGELGVSFWVKGEYIDEDDDGLWDHCNSTNISIISHPKIADWGDENEYDGEFYYEAGKYEEYGASDCNSDDRNRNLDQNHRGLIKVGRAGLACYAGEIEFESNTTVWVTYDDELLGDLFSGLGNLGSGGCSLCCGLIFLITGLIMQFTGTDDTGAGVGMVMTPDGQMVVTTNAPQTQMMTAAPAQTIQQPMVQPEQSVETNTESWFKPK